MRESWSGNDIEKSVIYINQITHKNYIKSLAWIIIEFLESNATNTEIIIVMSTEK